MSGEQPNNLFHAMLQASLDGMACLVPVRDDDGHVKSFQVIEANQRGAELLNLSLAELEGRLLEEFLTPSRAEILTRRFETVMNSGTPLEFEDEVQLHEEHAVVRHQVLPFRGGVLIQVRDITESYRSQQALRDSQDYLRSVITNAPIIMYELDRNGVFKLSTGSSLKQIGLVPDQAVGSSIFDFFEPGSPEVDAFERALSGETVSTQTSLADGFFASRYTPRHDDGGNIIGVLGVSYDITEQRLAEEQLQRAQRLEAVGQLTGGIAHDFNNLLAIVLGNLDLIEQTSDLNGGALEYLHNAMSATERGAILTKRLLAFSRQQLLEPSVTDVNELVAGMLGLLARTLPESIDISIKPAQDLRLTNVDPSQLEHAILNLCVNARDSMPNGGKLRIATRNVSLDKAHAVKLNLLPGDYVELSVQDTGSGISKELQNAIFEPFFTTKEVGKGSGLGLSMVIGFVEQSGGGIELESTLDEGTRFDLLLPATDRAGRVEKQEQHLEAADHRGKGERILIVEDDADVRQFVSHALSALNYDVAEARNASMALSMLQRGEPVDLLFTDIVLPGELNGIELAKEVEKLRPGIHVLLTSGYAGDADRETMSKMELIRKPYRTAELCRRLRALLDE